MKLTISWIFALLVITGSCKPNHVLVKFKNDSREDLKNIQVIILGKEFNFDSLGVGQTTKYVTVERTYPYCPVRAFTSSDTLYHWFIDYVGERVYTSGRLIMKLSIETDENKSRYLEIKTKRPLF